MTRLPAPCASTASTFVSTNFILFANQIGFVLQDTVLFRGTIRDNIAYGRPGATQKEIEEAAKLANADEFISRMPHGYDTMVGERGLTLSGGQRQRIGIARAVIRDTPILILDEPTAALDTESERLVIEALERLMKGRTVITIAHRLSTIRDADKIIVLKEGVVAEQGTHQELIASAEFMPNCIAYRSKEYQKQLRLRIHVIASHRPWLLDLSSTTAERMPVPWRL